MKVLVPLDGSVHAEGALAYLRELSPAGSLEVHLIAVVDNSEDQDPDRLSSQQNLLETYLRERGVRIDNSVASVETTVVQGSPATAILDEAARIFADLLIISSHSRSGIQRWRLGSVADKVVRGAVCDTLIIGSDVETTAPSLKSILLPLDGSELAEAAIPHAMRLVKGLGSELHIVRVITPPVVAADPSSLGYATPQLIEVLTEAAEQYVAEKKEQLGATHATSLFGSAADSLLTYIEENNIGMVIMTSHGRGGLLRSALGSVTDRLVGGPAAVLVVRGKSS